MDHIEKATVKALRAVVTNAAHTATVYLSPKLTVRVTRRLCRGRIPVGNNVDLSLTIGRPNWHARRVIKIAKRAGERFPIRKAILTFPPRRRA